MSLTRRAGCRPSDGHIGAGLRGLRTREQKREEMAWGLVVLLSRCGFHEVIGTEILAHKEGVRPGDVAPDDAVALLPPKPNQCFEAGAEIIGPITPAIGLIGHRDRQRRMKAGVVFDDNGPGADAVDRFPD